MIFLFGLAGITSYMPNLHYRWWFQMDSEARSLVTESEWCEWREDALRWFLTHGVEANLAEDLAQEVLLRLFRCQQRQQALTRSYLHRTCQSVLCDHERRCKRELHTLFLNDCCHCAIVERGYQQVEERLQLEQALAQLKPLERAIVERHYLEEQTFDAIGKELGIPTERAKKICQRAIKKMQKWAQSGGGGGITHTWLCPEEGMGGVLMNEGG